MAARVLVTGASGALGRATVARLGALGWAVAQIDGRGAGVDLCNEAAAGAAVARAVEQLGGLDALVHLAGGFAFKTLADSGLEDWRAMQAGNAESLFITAKAVLPHMADGGAIVAVGAASAARASAGMAAYAAAKSGVARLVEALAAELAPRGIRANAVLPGVIDTPTNRRDMPRGNPAKWTHPDAIADAIAFLIGPQSRAVNGVSLAVTNPVGAAV